jgi:putative chitinase
LAHFFSQTEHESGLKPISEKLNYSAKRMLEIFKSDFDTNRDKWLSPQEKEKVLSLIGHPDKIANFVYANQNGNGNENSGDGWKYRGRGFIQITGKENYSKLSKDTGIDCLKNPDLLLEESNAMISALWFWKIKGLNALSDKNDIIGITKKINGGTNGLLERKSLFTKYQKEL